MELRGGKQVTLSDADTLDSPRKSTQWRMGQKGKTVHRVPGRSLIQWNTDHEQTLPEALLGTQI